MAVKTISARDKLNVKAVRGLIREIIFLRGIVHPHIVLTYGHCWSPAVCLVMELMPKGSLATLLAPRLHATNLYNARVIFVNHVLCVMHTLAALERDVIEFLSETFG